MFKQNSAESKQQLESLSLQKFNNEETIRTMQKLVETKNLENRGLT